jgi:NAD+ synthase (glutamine-hydrolysing)
MKIVLCQQNYKIADFEGNLRKILAAIGQHGDDADLIVFTELCISGYYPKDLIERAEFMQRQNAALNKVREATRNKKAAVIAGFVDKNPFQGKRFHNALGIYQSGELQFIYHKQLLPVYNIFDEARHFEPGRRPGLWQLKDKRIGLLICEDAWGAHDPLYDVDPVEQLAREQLDLVISINASPSNIGKHEQRLQVIQRVASRCQAPVVYVNQVGGMDDVIFDGGSIAVDKQGLCIASAPAFEEAAKTIDLDNPQITNPPQPGAAEFAYRQLRLGLQDYVRKCGFKGVVVGSSGGIDSALTLALAVSALGSENVTAITMPSQYSSAGSVADSESLCRALGVRLYHAPIKEEFDLVRAEFETAFGMKPSNLTCENMQARIRGRKLMEYSNHTGDLVLSTGNKSELSVGYCTLYGDMNGGLSVIGDLYKTEVYALSRYINEQVFKREVIPAAILDKPPSAELAPGQADTDSLPEYDVLDAILRHYLEADLYLESDREQFNILLSSIDQQIIERVRKMVDRAEFKRQQAAPILRVQKRSFGFGRQIPIAATSLN